MGSSELLVSVRSPFPPPVNLDDTGEIVCALHAQETHKAKARRMATIAAWRGKLFLMVFGIFISHRSFAVILQSFFVVIWQSTRKGTFLLC